MQLEQSSQIVDGFGPLATTQKKAKWALLIQTCIESPPVQFWKPITGESLNVTFRISFYQRIRF